ncbi:glycoside hydrolase family 2 TIM barrel-domain containing protein [Seonamhaeicola marinus]|uniref:Glycoside hydrolase family 2 protein n=1 Tax=Seonamhaeicola marinus TaxID=1912246 RepID=A0A5D0JE14_9FLAO|nr:glycoside hydrolase family 2 TIM barrel-domain containing protein [Seonamhaeicola marinus]TYA92122.1 glycoside hydrolase family 2 protein [Seonamhaeicola marinus]
MNKHFFTTLLLVICLFSCGEKTTTSKTKSAVNRETDFNFDWKFKLQKDTILPTNLPLADSDWRDIRLPHDWSVEQSFSEDLEGCTGYLPGGVGVYQKHFDSPEDFENKSVFVLFDGVYNNATFWLNGKKLGENPYGYSPTYFDLGPFLNKDKENVLTVHVDHSRYADGRWYTGSGIYRNVTLVTLNKLHIPIWGTFINTPVATKEKADIQLETTVNNTVDATSEFTLTTKIIDNEGKEVASKEDKLSLIAHDKDVFKQNFSVANPKLWDLDAPNMYKAITTIVKNGKVVDEYTTPFGIRSLRFDNKSGFYLNEKKTDIKGVCIHHAAGLVGAAVPEGVWRRRFEKLKACGVNAIRTAHNPYSEEFMNLCDEMGILVQDEFFDEWDYAKDKRKNYHDRSFDYITQGYVNHFQEWAQSDLTRTMLRDRNHPSVFQWSIGNEIEWTYLHYRFDTGFWKDPKKPQASGGYWGSGPILTPEEIKANYDAAEKGEHILAETAHKLAKWTRELDPTRVITTNMVVPQTSMVSGYADAVDISGFSYRNKDIEWANKHWPERHITINENPGTWDDWKQVLENPGVFSIFMWTGIDYMGERDGDWPEKSGWGDLLDLAGFEYQGWNYFKSIWVDEPHISIGTLPIAKSGFKQTSISGQQLPENSNAYKWRDSNMHWNYEEGEQVVVEVCSNYSIVELFLNGKSLGSRSMSESPDRLFRWTIPFEAGTLTAKAGFGDAKITTELKTTSEPVGFTLTADKTTLKADGYDVSHFIVQLVDKDGLPVKTENAKFEFEVEGDAKILGVDNGARSNIQDFQSSSLTSAKGRALMILQSVRKAGTVKVRAKSQGFETQEVTLQIK